VSFFAPPERKSILLIEDGVELNKSIQVKPFQFNILLEQIRKVIETS